MPPDVALRRSAAMDTLISNARAIVQREGATRESLASVLEHLQNLALQPGFWTLADFPCLDEQVRQTRYLLREDEDHSFALYLITWLPGRSIAPHNHTTWACIAAAAGAEKNTLYERMDDGQGPGPARVEYRGTKIVSIAEGGLALLPDDIHAVDIVGDEPTLNLHLYGRALETLDRRLSFNLKSGTAAVRGIGVPSVRWTSPS